MIAYPSVTGAFTIPASVTSIGNGAFCACTGLKSVTIPDSVTNIEGAFQGCTSLISVIIGNGVTSIEKMAFAYCTSLTSVIIPNSVTSIETWAFRECTRLTSITIPDSVTSIEVDAFEGCTSLAAINIDKNNTAYSSQDGVLYNKNKTALIAYPPGKTGTFTIPDSVTNIRPRAFAYCTSLTSVIIPNSVISIGDYAFYSSTSLTSVTFQGRITEANLGTAFDGDLRKKYLTTGPGTYTTANPGNRRAVWTRQ